MPASRRAAARHRAAKLGVQRRAAEGTVCLALVRRPLIFRILRRIALQPAAHGVEFVDVQFANFVGLGTIFAALPVLPPGE